MMKKLLFLLLLALCSSVAANAQTTNRKKVAVYVTGKMDDVYKRIVSSKAISFISRSNNYVALERTEAFLSAMMKETDYQLSGEVADDQIVEIGARHGANYVAVFDANATLDGYCLITARLINVKSGVISRSVDSSRTISSTEDLVALTNNVAYRLFVQTK